MVLILKVMIIPSKSAMFPNLGLFTIRKSVKGLSTPYTDFGR